jgi:hypothetical protein
MSGSFVDFVRPRIEIPLELSCGPSRCPAADGGVGGPVVGDSTGGP